MLATLFAGLQTSLATFVSKSFIVSHLLPVALFLGASAAMAMALGGAPAQWAAALPVVPKGETGAWSVMAGAIAVTGAALLWSSIALSLFEVLEGKHLGWLAYALTSREAARRNELERELADHARRLRGLERPDAGGSKHEQMKKRLRDARTAPGPAPATGGVCDWWRVHRVFWKNASGLAVDPADLQAAVNVVAANLQGAPSPRADYWHADLLNAIDGTRERHRFEIQRLMNLRQFTFPSPLNAAPGQSALRALAPTRFGNVTLTIRSYALDRYGIDLDIFWSRLQKVAQSQDTATYGVLQDAKIQVDFLVSIFWLTALFTAAWTAITLWVQPSPRAFLTLGLIGPSLARLTYLAAVRSYVLFADIARSEVDLFRFNLLQGLHVGLPPGNQEESVLWSALGGWMGYGNDADITYAHKS